MKFIVVKHCSGEVLSLSSFAAEVMRASDSLCLIREHAAWTRERRFVTRFTRFDNAARAAKAMGGFVLSTRDAVTAGLIGKAAR